MNFIDNPQLPVLILFRHGQTDYNAQKRFQGQINCPLNAKGLEQAKKTGEHLVSIIQSFLQANKESIISECLTSDLSRANETANIVSQFVKLKLNLELPFMATETLREYHAGDLENHTLAEYSEKHPGVMDDYFNKYKEDPWDSRYPGIKSESWNMVSKRLLGNLKKLNDNFIESKFKNLQSYEDIPKKIFIWSTHGGIIGNLLKMMFVTSAEDARTIGNGDVLVLYPDSYNEAVPLDKQKQKLPTKQVSYHNCNVIWKMITHAKVGDSITALTDLQIHVK